MATKHEESPQPKNTPLSQTRRSALKKMIVGTGVAAGAAALPDKWARPIIDAITLPAHAQTSDLLCLSGIYRGPADDNEEPCIEPLECVELTVDCESGLIEVRIFTSDEVLPGTATITNDTFSGSFDFNEGQGGGEVTIEGTFIGGGVITGSIFGPSSEPGECVGELSTYRAELDAVCTPPDGD